MASLTAMTALGGNAARDEVIGGIRISEVADTDLASMAVRRGGGGDVETAAAKMLGGLPAAGGSLSKGGDSIIWMGVDQYLVEAAPDTGSRKSAATRLAAALGAAASVTDQSDAYVRFDLEGDRVADMLARLSAADNAGMDAGAAVRTPIHHMLCLLICREPGQRFTVYGPRSSAASLHHALTAAAGSLAPR